MNIPDLLRQIADHIESAPPDKVWEFWPSQIPGQQIERVTGDPSVDFTVAMLGGVPKPTFERDGNLAAWAAEHDDKVYTGTYHAGSVDDAAAGFAYAYSMSRPGSELANRLFFTAGVFGGPRAAIADMMWRGSQWRAGKGLSDATIVANYPDSEFKQAVLAVTV